MDNSDTIALEVVEWVADHLEAHGHLLVRGATLDEVAGRARAALGDRALIGADGLRLRILHSGWWRAEPCRCGRTIASSNHPRWHYRPAASTDADAWRGAEVRLVLNPSRVRGGR